MQCRKRKNAPGKQKNEAGGSAMGAGVRLFCHRYAMASQMKRRKEVELSLSCKILIVLYVMVNSVDTEKMLL